MSLFVYIIYIYIISIHANAFTLSICLIPGTDSDFVAAIEHVLEIECIFGLTPSD